jgi:hypothetical protein
MKQVFIMAVLVAAFSGVCMAGTNAPAAKEQHKQKPSQPAAKSATIKPAAAGPIDDLSKYIGTNDFYLALVREGVKKG